MLSVVFIVGHMSLWNKMSTLSYHPKSKKSPNSKCGSGKRIHSHRLSSKYKPLSFLVVLSTILLSLSYLPVVSAIETLRKNGHTNTKKEMVGLQDESGLPIQILDPNHSTNTESSASSLLAFAHTEDDISILEAIDDMPNSAGEHPVWFNPPPSSSTHHRLLRAGDATPQVCHNFVGRNQGHCTAFLSIKRGTCCVDAASTPCSKIEDKFSEPLTRIAICCLDEGAGLGDDCSATSGCPCSADLLCDGL